MESQHILSVLQQVQNGDLDIHSAYEQLKISPFEDLGYAKIDYHRRIRQGTPRPKLQSRWRESSTPCSPIIPKTF